MRIARLFTLAVPVVAAGAVAAWMLGFGQTPSEGLVYETAPITRGDIRKLVATSGPVRALVTVSVGSQLSGQVEDVKADFNTEVKPGDVLASLDAKTYASRVAQADADLAVARAALTNQEAALTKAQATMDAANRAAERQKQLAAKGFSAQSSLDTATRDAAVAVADIAVSKAQIESAKATIIQRQAQLDQAKIDLERTQIRSPIEGTVISRTVDPGQTVAASLQAPELFKIAQDLSRIRIEASVNEADVGSVAEGNAATFTVDAYPDRRFAGRVTQVRLSATELNNVVTYTVIIEASNEDRRLFPGMTANVSIEAARRDDVLRLFNDALRFRPRTEAGGSIWNASGRGNRNRDSAANGAQGGGNRAGGIVASLKTALVLTEAQEAVVRDALSAARGETGDGDRSGMRQRMAAKVEEVLAPLLTDAQKPLFAAWKAKRDDTKSTPVWIVGGDGKPERRMVQLGIADDQFTEVVGGEITEKDAVIVRARTRT